MKRFFLLVFTFLFLPLLSSCNTNSLNSLNEDLSLNSVSVINVTFDGKELDQKGMRSNKILFFHVEDVFVKFGYELSMDKDTRIFSNGVEKIHIATDKDYVQKNDLKIPVYNDFSTFNEDLYVSSTLLEQLIPAKFEESGDTVAITDITQTPYGWTKHKLVAHAFGSIKGRPETCSLEAMEYNYQNGFRLFESDFVLTSDNYLIARHDWSSWLYSKFLQTEPPGNEGKPLMLKEIKAMPIFNEFTSMDFKDVAEMMSKYRDMYLITDTKETDPLLVKKQFEIIVDTANEVDPTILDRIIPQFYLPEMYPVVKDIYNFRSYIFTLYMTGLKPEEVKEFTLTNNLQVVTMPYERANKEYMDLLNNNGILTYVHTLNDTDKMQAYLDVGVHGFYSAHILPRYFELETQY